MSSTAQTFASQSAHRAWLATQAPLPAGFRVATTRFDFTPAEAPKPARMTLTLIALDKPTPDFAAMFTRNAFPGAPVVIGRRRLAEPALGAILINNKIANVCAPAGVETAERICAETARLLNIAPTQILPSSTGVIGWTLPADAIIAALPKVAGASSSQAGEQDAPPTLAAAEAGAGGATILPAAEGIMTTDLYPKIRRATLGAGSPAGSIVGIAKGAGMIEPNMATMLVYILTDLAVPREPLRAMLARAVDASFNTISVDSDTSTSDTVVLLSSGKVPCAAAEHPAFERALTQVCRDLAEDIVRNGEGVRHVIRVDVRNAPDRETARALGKAIINAPLFKCAVAGNDPNVGRLIQAIGKHIGAQGGAHAPAPTTLDATAPAFSLDLERLRVRASGVEISGGGAVRLGPPQKTVRSLGKAIVNTPLIKKTITGNDTKVGRLIRTIGGHVGGQTTIPAAALDLSRLTARMGGIEIFADGAFRLDPQKETALVAHLRAAELYASAPPKDGVFTPPINYPPHERCVEIELDLASGSGECTVYGGDLTHEYVSENADYRS